MLRTAFLAWSMWTCGNLLAEAETAAPKLIFHADFDRPQNLVRHARGLDLAACRMLQLEPGRTGQALAVRSAANDMWADSAGNLDLARGTLSLWYRRFPEAKDAATCSLFACNEGLKQGLPGLHVAVSRGESLQASLHLPEGGLSASLKGIADEAWIHVAVTWDCQVGYGLYLNGKLARSKTAQWRPSFASGMLIGANYQEHRGNFARGLIDEVRIYDQPLTAQQVQLLSADQFQAEPARPDQPPPAAATDNDRPARETFHLSFDAGFEAQAAGRGTPLRAAEPELVDGVRGRAARFRTGRFLEYAEAGNLPKEQGAISLWYRPDWKAPTKHLSQNLQSHVGRPSGTELPTGSGTGSKIRPYLFREQGPRQPGANTIWLWFHEDQLRFDLRDPEDRYATDRKFAESAPGWRHIVAAWDCRRDRRLYVDGKLVAAGRPRGDSQIPFLPFTWPAESHESFVVGAETPKGVNSAEGTIDELIVFDRLLTESDVRQLYATYRPLPLEVAVIDPYPLVADASRAQVRLENMGPRPLQVSAHYEITNAAGQATSQGDLTPMTFGAGETVYRPLAIRIDNTEAHRCKLTIRDGQHTLVHDDTLWPVVPPARPQPDLHARVVQEIDLGQPLGKDALVDSDGKSQVVDSPLGKYREAAPARHSRFAVRLQIRSPGALHRVTWTYPDDKARTMDVILQPPEPRGDYVIQAGAMTGDEYPVTHTMIQQGGFFWPKDRQQILIFMTALEGQPAAVGRVRVEEVAGPLPRAEVQPYRGATPARSLGIYYEDPVLHSNLGTAPTMPDYRDAVDRLGQYMGWFGQDLLMYPTVWYQGPLYDSTVESGTSRLRSRPHPPFFALYLAKRLAADGATFMPLFNVNHLSTLNSRALIDLAAIRAGRDTPVNVMWNGQLKTYGWHSTDPLYNILDPLVQDRVRRLVAEHVALLKDQPGFKGIVFHDTRHCLLSLGSLDSGYNDGNLRRFEQDTGRQIPVDRRDPRRTFLSYRWLMDHAREDWIAWRCDKIREFYAQLAKLITATRPDAQLVVKPFIIDQARVADTDETHDGYEAMTREAGLDLRRLAQVPGISIQRSTCPADYRWRGKTPQYADARTEILATRTYRLLQGLPHVGLNMHDRYWENAIGRTAPLTELWGGKEHEWRVSTLNASPRYILENYAGPMGSVDLQYFTKGGFVLGFWGVEEPIRQFAQALRTLPAAAFQDVAGLSDPAAVRCAQVDGQQFFYAVNRFHHPVVCRLNVEGGGRLRDLVSGERLSADGLEIRLGPFQLRSFGVEGGSLRCLGGEQRVAAQVPAQLAQRVQQLQARLAAVRPGLAEPERFDRALATAARLAQQKRWAELHYFLQERWACELE